MASPSGGRGHLAFANPGPTGAGDEHDAVVAQPGQQQRRQRGRPPPSQPAAARDQEPPPSRPQQQRHWRGRCPRHRAGALFFFFFFSFFAVARSGRLCVWAGLLVGRTLRRGLTFVLCDGGRCCGRARRFISWTCAPTRSGARRSTRLSALLSRRPRKCRSRSCTRRSVTTGSGVNRDGGLSSSSPSLSRAGP